jgi:hypothetical protein
MEMNWQILSYVWLSMPIVANQLWKKVNVALIG